MKPSKSNCRKDDDKNHCNDDGSGNIILIMHVFVYIVSMYVFVYVSLLEHINECMYT